MDGGLQLGMRGSAEVLALPDEAAPFERVVGVRIPSDISLSYTYHFRPRQPY